LINTHLDKITTVINSKDEEELLNIVRSSLGTKFTSRFGDLIVQLALDAVKCVRIENPNQRCGDDIDIKK